MIPYLIWALIPKRYLVTAAAIAAILLGGWAAIALHNRSLKQTWFDRGYAVAHDSARMAGIAERRDSAAAHARALRDASLRADSLIHAEVVKANLHSLSPRIEAIPLPDSLARIPDPVLVTVESTQEHFVLPRAAARYWKISDSLVYVAKQLLDKYAAANKQWSESWRFEHEARLASDSLAALWRERAVNTVAPLKHSHARRDAIVAAIGAAVALVAHNNVRVRF